MLRKYFISLFINLVKDSKYLSLYVLRIKKVCKKLNVSIKCTMNEKNELFLGGNLLMLNRFKIEWKCPFSRLLNYFIITARG